MEKSSSLKLNWSGRENNIQSGKHELPALQNAHREFVEITTKYQKFQR